MRKAFLFAQTDKEVEAREAELRKTVSAIQDMSVVVITPEFVGAGAILGDQIITSLLLIRKWELLTVAFANGSQSQAVVVAKDECNHLAKLRTVSHQGPIDEADRDMEYASRAYKSHTRLAVGDWAAVGDPILVPKVMNNEVAVLVGAMSYITRVSECFEEIWQINSSAPRGMQGGAVSSDEGKFLGITIGGVFKDWGLPSAYAVPASTVMDFVETK